jgi:hypothetical protein
MLTSPIAAVGVNHNRIPVVAEMSLPDPHALAALLHGELRGDPPVASLRAVTIDCRCVMPGDLFLALPGRRRDGHAFPAAAEAAGAALAVVQRAGLAEPEAGSAACRLLVADPRLALQQLAAWYRRRPIGCGVWCGSFCSGTGIRDRPNRGWPQGCLKVELSARKNG